MIMKIKAINPEIIVSGDAKKPYFQIKYYDTADNIYHIGYGSYEYGNVIEWLEECFEVIEADEQPVVRGRWIDIEPEYNFERHRTAHYQCSKCGRCTGKRQTRTYNYCPNCGAKMDEEETHDKI